MAEMTYRRLGRSGLQVSVLSFGSWVSFGPQIDVGKAVDCLAAAHDAGCNFYDNAEAYASGESETIMGKAFAKLGWDRDSYVVSSKFFWGFNDGPNRRNTLNRKYLMQAVDGSLARFGLDFLDLIFCHRADPNTPIEETVWAMSRHHRFGQGALLGHLGVDGGRDPRRVGYRRPAQPAQAGHGAAAVQPVRARARSSASTPACTRTSASVSPRGRRWRAVCLRASTSTGRSPTDSRGALPGYEWLQGMLKDPSSNEKVKQMRDVADELGCTLAQLAIAWCASNPHVSTVITGASRPEQVVDNFGALDVLPKLTDDVRGRLKAIAR